MKKNILWILAFLITIGLALHQRATGPTYPVKGKVNFENNLIKYKLKRSHGGKGDQQIDFQLVEGKGNFQAFLKYKRYKTKDKWTTVEMIKENNTFKGFLPHQPPAGKIAYFVSLHTNDKTVVLTNKPVITRFKGAVPPYFLIPHIFCMFLAVFVSVRIGIAIIAKEDFRKMVKFTVIVLGVGGLILGPVVQKYAFGDLWTGIPFGWDFTDNKTLISFLVWIPALFLTKKENEGKKSTIFAVIIMLAIYLVPHSVLGSEFDYSKGAVVTGHKEIQVQHEEIKPENNSVNPDSGAVNSVEESEK